MASGVALPDLAAFAVLLLAVPLGAAFGSFACVVARRMARGADWVAGRSACEGCAAPIRGPDLVPVLGWLVLRGRCRACGAAIPPDHLVAELIGAALPVWACAVVPEWLFWPTCGLGWTLLLLSLIDAQTQTLPRSLTGGLALAGLGLMAALGGAAGVLPHALAALAGWAAFEAIAWAHLRLRGVEGLGLGDAVLLGAAGAWVGTEGLASVVLLAALGGLGYAALTRTGPGVRLPFGPFLAGGLWLVWLHGPVLPG